MTQTSGTFDSYDSINFEDLSNVLYNIAPTQTPFVSRIGRTKATATFHEWTIETLAAAGANSVIEADVATIDTGNTGTRVGNRVQILDKAIIVSDTNDWIRSPGDNASLAHQLAIKTKEIKRDLEFVLVGANTASVTGSSSVARLLGSYESWITTNDSRATVGTPGTDGGFTGGNTVAATDGTQRPFTEALLKAVLAASWVAGGEPDMVMVGAFNKQVASGFAGIATQYKNNPGSGQATIIAGADVYVGDFGQVQIVPNRFSRSRSAFVVDTSMWALATGAPLHMDELAKTGHAEQRMITMEVTLEARNEASSGIVADLTTS